MSTTSPPKVDAGEFVGRIGGIGGGGKPPEKSAKGSPLGHYVMNESEHKGAIEYIKEFMVIIIEK